MTVIGIVLTPSDGVRWRFDPGALFLEFLLTGGPGDLAAFDRLHEPDDLRGWVDVCRLGLSGADVAVTNSDIRAGRELRDSLWRATRGTIAGVPVSDADRDVVDRMAAAAPLVPTWAAGWRTPADGPSVLSTIARDAIAVLTGSGRNRVRECAADDCRLVFLDTSRPDGRRWCSMRRCGNRHKVREHRTRTQEVPHD